MGEHGGALTGLHPEMLLPVAYFAATLFVDLLFLYTRTRALHSNPSVAQKDEEGPLKVLGIRCALVVGGYVVLLIFAAKKGFLHVS